MDWCAFRKTELTPARRIHGNSRKGLFHGFTLKLAVELDGLGDRGDSSDIGDFGDLGDIGGVGGAGARRGDSHDASLSKGTALPIVLTDATDAVSSSPNSEISDKVERSL